MVSAMAQQPKTIFELLGIEPDVFSLPSQPVKPPENGNGKPLGEEDIKALSAVHKEALKQQVTATAAPAALPQVTPVEVLAPEIDLAPFRSPARRFFSRNYVRYPLIFLLALGFFYVILNFGALYTQVKSYLFAPGATDEEAAVVVVPEYTDWAKKYYVHLGDPEIMASKNDADLDGLLNAEEYYLGTNPLRWDTDADGFSDGQDALNGYNPVYVGKLTATQQTVVADYVNLESVRSRLALREYQQVAGMQTSVGREFTIDTSKPGQISIPALNVQTAIIWTSDFAKMEEDLKSGAAHHPATPFPGERGTVSIHGHSSGNFDDGDYKTVFTKLNFLEAGDEVLVTVYNSNSEGKQFRYVVRSAKVYSKTDPAQFEQKDGYFLNLSTSWPIGTALQRYVVTTELVGL